MKRGRDGSHRSKKERRYDSCSDDERYYYSSDSSCIEISSDSSSDSSDYARKKTKRDHEKGLDEVYKIAEDEVSRMRDKIGVEMEIPLSEDQKEVIDSVMKGRNVFFTGPAGVGKTFVLKRIIEVLRRKNQVVAITASTGIAAEPLGGSTLHSFAGCGIVKEKRDFQRIYHPDTKHRWKELDVLIIDEVSMLSGEFFDGLEEVVRALRYGPQIHRTSSSVFGGIQLVLCGDFFQLPPILNLFDNTFLFEASAWSYCAFREHTLTTIHRQTDKKFIKILNSLRYGDVTDDAYHTLKGCQRSLPSTIDGITLTKLFTHNKDVDETNSSENHRIKEDSRIFSATREIHVTALPEDYTHARDCLERHSFWKSCLAREEIKLKIGSQVMLLRNLDLNSSQMLVNGSRGVVIGFKSAKKVLKTLTSVEGREKFQKRGVIDICSTVGVPIVRFQNGRKHTVLPEEFSAELTLIGHCRRIQIPLCLAWALTVHKCQGMTLDRAKIDISKCFEAGQAYTAISRLRSLEGLQLVSFTSTVVYVNPKVLEFFGITPTRTTNLQSSSTSPNAPLGFGKHADKTMTWVAEHDQNYCDWALSLPEVNGAMMRFVNFLQSYKPRR